MNCPNCKKEINNSEMFCPYCFSAFPSSSVDVNNINNNANNLSVTDKIDNNCQKTIMNMVTNNNSLYNKVEVIKDNLDNSIEIINSKKKFKKNSFILFAISILMIVGLYISNYWINNSSLRNKVLNINDYCPNISNNIKKIELVDQNINSIEFFILTNNGDVYSFRSPINHFTSSYFCDKIIELSSVDNIIYSKNQETKDEYLYIKSSNKEEKKYIYSNDIFGDGYIIALLGDLEEDSDFKFLNLDINKYFYHNRKLYYIENKNVYHFDNKDKQNVIEGASIFENNIIYFSTNRNLGLNDNINFYDEEYIYTFDEEFHLISKNKKIYGIYPKDIVAIGESNNLFLKDGSINNYNEKEEIQYIKKLMKDNSGVFIKYLLLIIGFDTMVCYLMYRGKDKTFGSGYIMFITIYGICCFISIIISKKYTNILRIPIFVPIFGLVLFALYFGYKHLFWYIMKKIGREKFGMYYVLYHILLIINVGLFLLSYQLYDILS